MQRKLLTRPRLAAAAALSLGTLVAGALSPTPVHAGDCVSYSAYIYNNQTGPSYIGDEKNCAAPTPWRESFSANASRETDTWLLPPGTPSGAGVEVWVPMA